jgi:hypothetical protein
MTTVESSPPEVEERIEPPGRIDDQYPFVTPLNRCIVVLFGPNGIPGAGGLGESLVLSDALLCVAGFTPNEPVSVLVQHPDGSEDTLEAQTEGSGAGAVLWTSLPGFPLGTYSVVGTQGGSEAIGTFELLPASAPKVRVVPARGPPDSGFVVAFVLFPDGDDLSLFLYHVDEEHQEGAIVFATYGFVQTLSDGVLTDGGGELVFPIEDVPLEEGGYCIFYAESGETSLSHGCIRFDVAS